MAVAPRADHVLALQHDRRQTCLETDRTRLVRREVGKLKDAPVHHVARLLADAAVQVEYRLWRQIAAEQEIRAGLLGVVLSYPCYEILTRSRGLGKTSAGHEARKCWEHEVGGLRKWH